MKKFHTVEINNSFYQLPEKTTFENWRDIVPEGFIFSAKASRYIMHMKKLKEPKKPLDRFLKRTDALADKLGPFLFQLPLCWKCNCERLKSFPNMLPDEFRYMFEFRDPSRWNNQVYEALSERNVAFCIFELSGNLTPKEKLQQISLTFAFMVQRKLLKVNTMLRRSLAGQVLSQRGTIKRKKSIAI